MEKLVRLPVLAAVGVVLLGWTQTAWTQEQEQRPEEIPGVRGRHVHDVTVTESGGIYELSPASLEVQRQDWVRWKFDFPTEVVEVELCKTFEAGGAFSGGVGRSPAERCVYSTEKDSGFIKVKVRLLANSGTYQYSIAFKTGGITVVIDPELIVRP